MAPDPSSSQVEPLLNSRMLQCKLITVLLSHTPWEDIKVHKKKHEAPLKLP